MIITPARMDEFKADTATVMEILLEVGAEPIVTTPDRLTIMSTFTGHSDIFGGEVLIRLMKDFSPRLSIKTAKPHADKRVIRSFQLAASDLTTGTFASYWLKSLKDHDVEFAMRNISEQIKDYNSDYLK